ncbi:C2H2 and C2HC zinc finger protein [Rutstroemia sp. NJR-2017a BVV2]|nr:C2H2 and C2HC zinc finger protein [Rutstroemia sp. NJR-2017a BVV2]
MAHKSLAMDHESPDVMSEEPEYEFDTPSPAYSDSDQACSPKSVPRGVPPKSEPPSTKTEGGASCNPAQTLGSGSTAAKENTEAQPGQVSQDHDHLITSFMTDLPDRVPEPQLTPARNQTVNGESCGPEPFSPSKHFKLQTTISRVKIAKICQKPSKEKTFEDVQEESRERGKDIWRAWAYLKGILERHEVSIRKRWGKTTKDKRRQILQNAWPKIQIYSLPHIVAYREESSEQRIRETRYRDAYLFPHINLTDLSDNKKNLLMFLNKRGRCAPSLFVRTDHNHMRAGLNLRALQQYLLVGTRHLMLLEDEENYGALELWNGFQDSPEDNNWAIPEGKKDDGTLWYGRGLLLGDGLLVLEIQQRTLHFLIRCCQEILSHLEPDELVAGDGLESANVPPPVDEGGDTLSITAVGQSKFYSCLGRPSFTRLKDILYARRALAEDHLWLLKSDPGYFGQQLQATYDHDLAHIPSRQSKLTSYLGKPEHWDSIIKDTICAAYRDIISWDVLCRIINATEALVVQKLDQMSPRERLSTPLGVQLLLLKYGLEQQTWGADVVNKLRKGIASSPALRSSFERKKDGGITFTDDLDDKHLLYQVAILWDTDQQDRWGLFETMNNIDTAISGSLETKKQVSPYVAELLADTGIKAYILSELDNFQPWMLGITQEIFKQYYEDDVKKAYESMALPILRLVLGKMSAGKGISKLGDPTDGRFNYPKEGPRTRSNVETLRAAEKSLDDVWAELRKMLESRDKQHWDGLVQGCLDTNLPWIVDRTPEWKHFETETREAEVTIMGRKVEPNSRMAKSLNFCVSADIPYVMLVPLKALNVFSIIFRQVPLDGVPKKRGKKIDEISWNDFVAAMAAVGFGATRFHCSLWHFVPEGVPVSQDTALLRSIMIHEPWEDSKISLKYARLIGMRLKRMYGWHIDMFAEENVRCKGWDAYRFHDFRQWYY